MYRIALFHGATLLTTIRLPSLPCEGIEVEIRHPGQQRPTVYILQQLRLLCQPDVGWEQEPFRQALQPDIPVRAWVLPVRMRDE